MQMGEPTIDHIELSFPTLPSELEGLRIVHISDLHVHHRARRFDRLAEKLAALPCDLAMFTGDYMTFSHHEQAAVQVMAQLVDAVQPRHGRFGIFGNHDSPEIKPLLQNLPIQWLNNDAARHPELPLDLLGVDTTEDRVSDPFRALTRAMEEDYRAYPMSSRCERVRTPAKASADPQRWRILLSHIPNLLPIASDMGVGLMLSGHTHGGQIRLPGIGPVYNSTDLPLAFTSGILRYGDTLCAVTRGLGEVHLTFRMFCPRQLPIYTLRRGRSRGNSQPVMQCVERW